MKNIFALSLLIPTMTFGSVGDSFLRYQCRGIADKTLKVGVYENGAEETISVERINEYGEPEIFSEPLKTKNVLGGIGVIFIGKHYSLDINWSPGS